MSRNLEVSLSVKQSKGKIPFAAVQFKDDNETKTLIFRAGQKHLNEMFIDVLNFSVLKEIEAIADKYDNIQLNLDKNKYTGLIKTGNYIGNDKDQNSVQKTAKLYQNLLSIHSKTNLNCSFEHKDVTHIYNEVLSYDEMSALSEVKLNQVFGDLIIAKKEVIENKKELNIENPMQLGELSAFIDIVENKNPTTPENRYYVGIALSRKTESGVENIMSKITTVSHLSTKEALEDQIRKAFFKGETNKQSSYLTHIVNKDEKLNVFTSEENKENLKEVFSELFKDKEINISSVYGDNIKKKLEVRIENDKKLNNFDQHELKASLESKEIYNDKFNMAIYMASSITKDIATFSAVVRAPNSDDIIYEIEGKINEDTKAKLINEQERDAFQVEKDGIYEVLTYIAGKVRNGHIPNNMNFEIRSNNLYLMSALKNNILEEFDEKKIEQIRKDIKSDITYSWTSDKYLDPYIRCAKETAKSARELLNKNVVLNIDYQNENIIKGMLEDEDYKFSKKRTLKLKM